VSTFCTHSTFCGPGLPRASSSCLEGTFDSFLPSFTLFPSLLLHLGLLRSTIWLGFGTNHLGDLVEYLWYHSCAWFDTVEWFVFMDSRILNFFPVVTVLIGLILIVTDTPVG